MENQVCVSWTDEDGLYLRRFSSREVAVKYCSQRFRGSGIVHKIYNAPSVKCDVPVKILLDAIYLN